MVKKVFDILPPKKTEEKEEIFEKESLKFQPISFQPPKIRLKKFWILFSIFSLFLIIFLASFYFTKIEIKIWPKTEKLIFQEKLTVDIKAEALNLKQKIIPGKIFEEEKIFFEEFQASGKVLKKAEGIIRLFNAYSTQPEVWLEGTRFVSSEGKLFKSKSKIHVPGAKIEDGKIQPSFVDVPVIAAEGGSEYNIGPSHFSILAYKGTPRYFKFYGQSFQAMKGGGEAPQVTKEDLERAEKILMEKIKTEGKKSLKNKIPTEFTFLEDVFEIKILEKTASVQPGTEVEKFNFQSKVKLKTIAFLKEDLINFAKEYISPQLPLDKKPYLESLKLDYSSKSFDFDTGKVLLSLNFSVKIFPEIDLVSFKKALVEKPFTEVEIFLSNQPEFSKVEIHLFPPWLKTVPDDLEKIKIKYPIIETD